jgi:hypothetical protein
MKAIPRPNSIRASSISAFPAYTCSRAGWNRFRTGRIRFAFLLDGD